MMEYILELLKIILPAGIVFAAVYFVLQRFLDNQEKREELKIRRKSAENINPLRIQAYERLILFVERISPDNLVMRTQRAGMSARMHQSEMIKVIRKEYEHNLTQQIYVSNQAWALVRQSKEEVIRIINIASSKCDEKASGVELSKLILSMLTQIEHVPTDVAKRGLKKEFNSKF